MLGGDEIGHVDDDIGGCTGVVDVPLGVVGVGGVAAICFKKDRVAKLKGFKLGFVFALDVGEESLGGEGGELTCSWRGR